MDNEKTLVTLRPITEDDALPFMETVTRNRDIFRHTIPWLADAEGWRIRSYIAIWEADQKQKAGLHLLIEADNRVLGVVNMHTIDWERSIAHLGYWLSSDAQGYGIATEAVSWLTRYALEKMDLDYLDISTRADNLKSQKVAERAGYTLSSDIEDFEWIPDEFENGAFVKVPLTCYIYTNPLKMPWKPLKVARPDNFYAFLTDPSNRVDIDGEQ